MTAVALVGLGAIGLGAHLPALLRHDRVELVGLVDPDAERCAEALRLLPEPVPTYATLDDLPDGVDAVVIATPPWVTPTLAQAALARGWHVLIEKPVATSVAGARQLLDLPPDVTRRVQVGLTYRHDPAIEQLRTWVRGGILGAGPIVVRAHIYDEVRDPDDAAHTALITTTLRHGTPALHEGSHLFDWLSFVLDEDPTLLDAWAVRTDHELAAPNLVGGRLGYADGSVLLVEFGWFTTALPRCQLELVGGEATIRLDLRSFTLTLERAGGSEVVGFEGDRVERSFARQLAAFIAGVEAGSPLVPSLQDGVRALAAAERLDLRARESLPRSTRDPRGGAADAALGRV